MADKNSGDTPPQCSQQGQQQAANQEGHHNNSNCNRRSCGNNQKFEGKVEEPKYHVYDVGGTCNGTDVFAITTKEIAKYITRQYRGTGEFITAIDPDVLVFETLVDPSTMPPDEAATMVTVEIWKLELKQYVERMTHQTKAGRQAFAVVLGQCSQTVHDHLEVSATWANIKATADLMGLLQLIQQPLFSGAKKSTDALQDAALTLYSFCQSDGMSNRAYLTKFKAYVEQYEHHGGQPGLEER